MTRSEWEAYLKAQEAEGVKQVQNLKAKGLKGWALIDQFVAGRVLASQICHEKPELNRVDRAFLSLDYLQRRRLLGMANLLAQEQGQSVEINANKPLDEFKQAERAWIACALREMREISSKFGQNLKFYEFHETAKRKGNYE
ncbi:hypothetical protein ACSFCC_09515 [Glaesserella parasuis]|uniref:hypothetical protein n=1 Tax=Glaesserella parasuis TaxID=738 RepID=UPI0021BFFEF3|nr:hypothetical protein [Glaesserella parasuis]MCT8680155.1 hypothetical protein [Glaesserella parasuis]MDO9754595.1 hypothetical protein [Glaesserella parasuis]